MSKELEITPGLAGDSAMPQPGSEDWRAEVGRLVAAFAKGHLMSIQETSPGQKWPQIVPGAYEAWERAWLLINRDEEGNVRAS